LLLEINTKFNSLLVQGGPKTNGLFLGVDNLVMVNGRKACDMSKIAEFCLAREYNLHVSAFKYSMPCLHVNYAEFDKNA